MFGEWPDKIFPVIHSRSIERCGLNIECRAIGYEVQSIDWGNVI